MIAAEHMAEQNGRGRAYGRGRGNMCKTCRQTQLTIKRISPGTAGSKQEAMHSTIITSLRKAMLR